jgi:hypothetical protein
MPVRSRTLVSAPVLAIAAATGAASLIAVMLFEPEAVIRRSVEAALANTAKSPDVATASRNDGLDHRNIWLSNLENQPLGFVAPVKVGDRIDISGRGKPRRVLEVVDIRELPTGVAPATETFQRLLVVSCREVGSKDNRVMRFVMEAEELDATHKTQAQRTL